MSDSTEHSVFPSLDYVKESPQETRTRVLHALYTGDDVSITFRSGREYTGHVGEARPRRNRQELQAKISGDRFILILRIPYDDNGVVTAETYSLS